MDVSLWQTSSFPTIYLCFYSQRLRWELLLPFFTHGPEHECTRTRHRGSRCRQVAGPRTSSVQRPRPPKLTLRAEMSGMSQPLWKYTYASGLHPSLEQLHNHPDNNVITVKGAIISTGSAAVPRNSRGVRSQTGGR